MAPRCCLAIFLPLVLMLIALLPQAAPGQGPEGEVADLKARLAIMEQKLEKLLDRNEHLEKRLADLELSPAPPGSPPTPGTAPVSEDVSRLIEDYLRAQSKKEPGKESIPREKGKEGKADAKDYEVGKDLKMEAGWKNALIFDNKDKSFRWAVGGVSQSDMFWFGAGKPVVNSIGVFNNLADPGQTLQDGMAFRRARLRFSGLIWEQVEFFAQYEFAQALDLRRRTLGISPVPGTPPINDFDPSDNVGFNEVYLGLVKLPYLGQVRVGRHRESLNFVTATADNNQVWLERGLMFDAFNGDFNFSNGVTVQNTWLDDRVYGLVGFFQANNNSNRGFYSVGDGEYVYDGRLTCLPMYDEERELWVHLGVDYSYRNVHQQQLRYRARPMVRGGPAFLTPNVVNTGTIFTPDAQQIANLEFALACGRFTFAAEGAVSWVTNAYTGGLPRPDGTLPPGVAARGTYLAQGGYIEALYFLTPDHRKYLKDRPGYARVVPRNHFYFLKGETGHLFNKGGWEAGVRYDYLDLNDSGINGGSSQAVTFALNWYLNANARIQANYFWMDRAFAPADNLGRVNGDLTGLGVRFNVDY